MSQSNKVVILGAGGLLGTHVVKAFERFSPNLNVTSQTNERFSNSVDITSYLSNLEPATVINCMAHLGADPMLNLLVNACLPRCIADWCERHDSLCVHISTNAVFAPDEEYFWNIHDPLAPETPYEISKAFGEDPRAYVIRTSFIGNHPRGQGVYDRLCSGMPFVDRKWNGVTAWVLAKRIVEIVNQDHSSTKSLIEHVHSPDVISFKELSKFLQSMSPCKKYVRDTRLLGGGSNFPDIKTQIEEYIRENPSAPKNISRVQ